MKRTPFLVSAVLAYLLIQSAFASEIQTKIQGVFGDKSAVVSDYDKHLKKVVVNGSKVYFATHNGRYLFGGPIIDTEQRTNIVSLQENQLRQTYLNSLPEDVFVNYPSSTPNKHKITVITDIDCPYCRKFHSHMKSFNQLGISVNYVMLPRAGVGSASHAKTVAALCSDNPADSITNAMQNENLAPHNCEPNVMNQHMKIVRDLKIKSTLLRF